jgi:hypothetical protein
MERETERVRSTRAQSRPPVNALPPDRLKLVDESGVDVAMSRLFGRTRLSLGGLVLMDNLGAGIQVGRFF